MTIERTCNECGSSEWSFVLDDAYPERRKDRAQTVKEVYVCENCGAEGRLFDQQNDGTTTYSGAFR